MTMLHKPLVVHVGPNERYKQPQTNFQEVGCTWGKLWHHVADMLTLLSCNVMRFCPCRHLAGNLSYPDSSQDNCHVEYS